MYANTIVQVRAFFLESGLMRRMRSFKRRFDQHEYLRGVFNEMFGSVSIEPFRRVVPLKRLRKAFFARVASSEECPVCSESLSSRKHFMLVCGHALCTECVSKISQANPGVMSKCPLCRQRMMPMMIEMFGAESMFCTAELKDKEGRVVGRVEFGQQPVEFIMQQDLLVDVLNQDTVNIGLLKSSRGDVVSIHESTMP